MNPAAGSLNLVLGHSTRMAKNEINRHKNAKVVCIVSPSPRAARRMDDAGMTETFRAVGQTLKKMERLEIHFYSTGAIWLPMAALGMLISNAKNLQFLLLNGMRLKGSMEELVALGNVFKHHPSLDRMSLFNINSLQPTLVPLHPLLEGIRANPVIRDVALRYASWAANGLESVAAERSQIKILRMSGKQTCHNERGDSFPRMFHAMKTNMNLEELSIHQAVGPHGSGLVVADMLKKNKHLKSINMELGQFTDACPIADVLERENSTLKKLDLKFHNTDPQKARPQVWTDVNGGTSHSQGTSLRRIVWDSDDSDSDEEEEVKHQRLRQTIRCFEKALETNTSMEDIRFITPGGERRESYTMMLRCKLNAGGWRKNLIMNDDICAESVISFLVSQNELEETEGEPVSPMDVTYTMLRSKPSLIWLAISEFSKQPENNKEEDVKMGVDSPRFAVSSEQEEDEEEDNDYDGDAEEKAGTTITRTTRKRAAAKKRAPEVTPESAKKRNPAPAARKRRRRRR